ncbi:MAG: tetratricopeptide repeat protein [Magnetococcus sp. DMHC-6]
MSLLLEALMKAESHKQKRESMQQEKSSSSSLFARDSPPERKPNTIDTLDLEINSEPDLQLHDPHASSFSEPNRIIDSLSLEKNSSQEPLQLEMADTWKWSEENESKQMDHAPQKKTSMIHDFLENDGPVWEKEPPQKRDSMISSLLQKEENASGNGLASRSQQNTGKADKRCLIADFLNDDEDEVESTLPSFVNATIYAQAPASKSQEPSLPIYQAPPSKKILISDILDQTQEETQPTHIKRGHIEQDLSTPIDGTIYSQEPLPLPIPTKTPTKSVKLSTGDRFKSDENTRSDSKKISEKNSVWVDEENWNFTENTVDFKPNLLVETDDAELTLAKPVAEIIAPIDSTPPNLYGEDPFPMTDVPKKDLLLKKYRMINSFKNIFDQKEASNFKRFYLLGGIVFLGMGILGGGFWYFNNLVNSKPNTFNFANQNKTISKPVTKTVSAPLHPPEEKQAPVQTQEKTTPAVPVVQQPIALSQATPSPPVNSVPDNPRQHVLHAARPAPEKTSVTTQTEQDASSAQNSSGIHRQQTPKVSYMRLVKAHEGLLTGQQQDAQKIYQSILENDPNNRDAKFGLASLAILNKNFEMASRYYLDILDRYPNDTKALAGFVGLKGAMDSTRYEGLIKQALEQDPQAAHLYFALGVLYAGQKRWNDAQGAFFRAYTGNNNNPDYAFNLAVSLDHMAKGKAALPYYQRALEGSKIQSVNFDVDKVNKRIQTLTNLFTSLAPAVSVQP